MLIDFGLSMGMAGLFTYIYREVTDPTVKIKKKIKNVFEAKGTKIYDKNSQEKYPLIKKIKPTDSGYSLELYLPEGMSRETIEKVQTELEFALDGEMDIEQTGNNHLYLKFHCIRLPDSYPYKFEGIKDHIPSNMEVPWLVGRSTEGWKFVDLESKHLLIGGISDSGKSTSITAGITTLKLLDPTKYWFCMLDFKFEQLEAEKFKKHMEIVGGKNIDDALLNTLEKLEMIEMEIASRAKLFKKYKVQKIKKYNEKSSIKMPYMFVFIDELAALTPNLESGSIKENPTKGLKQEIFKKLILLATQGRAFGLILVPCTQRPTQDVICGLIKNNMHYRQAFWVNTSQESENILGDGLTQAAKLKKTAGRCVISAKGITRCQVPLIEWEDTTKILKDTLPNPKLLIDETYIRPTEEHTHEHTHETMQYKDYSIRDLNEVWHD